MRLLCYFALTAWSAWSSASRSGGLATLATPPDGQQAAKLSMTGPGRAEGGLGNGVVFTWAILGVLSWFWVFIFDP